jgi:hypothetical protein
MINAEELAICRKRGHTHNSYSLHPGGGYVQCESCGMWRRERIVEEETEVEPPAEELSPSVISDRIFATSKAKAKS